MIASASSQTVRLGVVSFLNARPLVHDLNRDTGIELLYDVPSALPGYLNIGQVDAALVPAIDLTRHADRWAPVSDACIGSSGETLTVRVFSHVPPAQIDRLYVDGDSHTSIVLAAILWNELYGKSLPMRPYDPAQHAEPVAVLLIGDKVVTRDMSAYAHQIDLGGAWRELTGLPFVFALWCARIGEAPQGLSDTLESARDRGVADAGSIAQTQGPAAGWDIALARRYLTEHLDFCLTARHQQGMARFFELAEKWNLLPRTIEATAT